MDDQWSCTQRLLGIGLRHSFLGTAPGDRQRSERPPRREFATSPADIEVLMSSLEAPSAAQREAAATALRHMIGALLVAGDDQRSAQMLDHGQSSLKGSAGWRADL